MPASINHKMTLCFILFCCWMHVIQSQGNHEHPRHRAQISLDDFPNPLDPSAHQACGRATKSFICDPRQFLNSDTADHIDSVIFNATESNLVWCSTIVENDEFIANPKEKTRDHYNGLQIGIAIISSFRDHPHSRLRRSDDIAKKSQIYAKSIHDQWGVGQSGCNNAMMVFINIYDRYLYISTGSGIKSIISDEFVNDFIIPKHIKPLMRASKYGEAVQFIVRSVIDVLQNSDDLDKHELYQSFIAYTTPDTFLGLAYDTWLMIVLFLGGITFMAYKFHSERDYRECKRHLAGLHAQKQAKKFASSSCPICLEEFPSNNNNNSANDNENGRQTAILICGHKFCKQCLDSWFASQSVSNQKCPICRHERDDWSMLEEKKENEDHGDDEKARNNEEDNMYEHDEKNVNEEDDDYTHTHDKTSTSDTFYEATEEKQHVNTGNNNGFGFRRRNRNRDRRGMNMNDWLFQQELLFRMRRIRYMYPRYVTSDMVDRWSQPNYSGTYSNDQSFVRANPNYRPPASRSGSSWSSGRGSGFSFGGGSSRGGGGGGGSW